MIYTIGKGPSAVTVSAPQTGVSVGSSFTITGTVTDQSPGATAYAHKIGYANGVPSVSDASQEALMEYIYLQQPKPSNATGVPVRIDVIDPNGNFVNIGTTKNLRWSLRFHCGYKQPCCWTRLIPSHCFF